MTQKRTLVKHHILLLALATHYPPGRLTLLRYLAIALAIPGITVAGPGMVVKISSTTNSWPSDMGWH